jgi:hypothetical protein
MDQNILVKEALTKEKIAAGKELLKKLERSPLNVKVALWLYDLNRESWKLLLSPAGYEENSIIKMYEIVRDCLLTLSSKSITEIELNDILITNSRDEHINALLSFVKQSEVILGNNRLGKTMINGVYFEDGYLYKVSLN